MLQLRPCTIRRPIHLRLLIYVQIRCIRTKPVQLLPPKHSSILPSWGDVQRDFRKRIRRKPEDQRIPMVPKFTEDERAIMQPKVKNETVMPSKPPEKETVEDTEEEQKLREQEERIKEFEREQKAFQGKTPQEVQRSHVDNARVSELNPHVEQPDNTIYPRDVIGRKFKKEKAQYKVDVYPTKRYLGYLAVPLHRKKMAQAAAEIIQEYHQHMNGEKLGEMLDKCDKASVQLPSEVILEEIDPRHLALPFPPEAILPAMRLVFATMKNQVRFALSDHQVNSIFTGADFINHLLNPPKPAINPNQPIYIYDRLREIQFPPNVTIVPDKQLEKRTREALNAVKSRQAKIAQQRKAQELLATIKKERYERRIGRKKRLIRDRRRLEEQEQAQLQLEKGKDENYSQFYGRPM